MQQNAIGFWTSSFTYSNDLVSTFTDQRGLTVTNTWDNLQRLTSRTYPDGTYISNQYTWLDLTAAKDRLGNWTYYGYDQLRRNIAVTNALGKYELFSYCSCGALESVQDALGNITRYYYDNQSRLTNVLYPDSYTLNNAYNLVGQLTNVTDGAGISISNWFNNQGLLVASSNGFGRVTARSYDVLDRATNTVDANGVSLSTSYDNLNRVATRTYPDGGDELFGYSAFGLIAYTNQLANVTYYAYDAARRKIAETNALAQITQYGYSPASDLISLTDAKSNVTRWGYDVYGRVTNKVDATTTTILTYQYDADNRLTNRWSLAKSNTVYAYDAVGNLTNVTYYHTNHALSFSYDAMNRMTSMSDGIGTTTFTYTPAGQLASETGPWASDTVAYTYSDRLRTKLDLQQPNASDWIQTYSYDLAARMYAIVSPAGTFTYAYSPGLAGTTSASWLTAKIALPNGAFITNTYDNNGRMLGTWLYNSGATALDSSVYTYNVGNQRTNVTRTGENTAAYTYDAIGQVIGDQAYEVSGGAARMNEQLHYGFDAAGNLSYRTNNALIENFQVNTLNELTTNTNGGRLTVVGTTTSPATKVAVNGTNAQLYGDATFAATNMPLTTSYTAVASDSLGRWATNVVGLSIATNNAAFQYDGNGNLTSDGLRSFVYDDENQLIQVCMTNQWLSQFAYDGKMRRRIRQEFAMRRSGWAQTNEVYYVYDGNVVVQERTVNNLPTTTYTRGQDLSGSLQGAGGIGGLLSMTLNTELGPSSSNSMYYHSDGNGNVTMLINPSQYIVAKYLYDAFGNILSKSGLLADPNLYRFSSKEAHPNSGLVYYLYRYYDPHLQRWLNRDPIGEIGGINLYGFARGNLISVIDPFGLCWRDHLTWLTAPLAWAADQINNFGNMAVGVAEQTVGASLSFAGDMANSWGAYSVGSALSGVGDYFAGTGQSDAGTQNFLGNQGFYDPSGTTATTADAALAAATIVLTGIPEAAEGTGTAARFIVSDSGQVLDTSAITIPGPVNSAFGKIDYLLGNVTTGDSAALSAGKGGFFSGVMGYDQTTLGPALQNQLIDNFGSATINGNRISVVGPMSGPSGTTANVLSAWQVTPSGSVSFITAFPK
jgi:RHS repeat-associated protein